MAHVTHQFPPRGHRLTEHELRRLAQLELQLRRDDPALARTLDRGTHRGGPDRVWIMTYALVTLLAVTIVAVLGGVVLAGAFTICMLAIGRGLYTLRRSKTPPPLSGP
jgi:hypothetical protein